jgi:glycosyltransferase involved in cell wall biosynthesis
VPLGAEWAPRLPARVSIGRGAILWLEGGLPPEAALLRQLRLCVDGEPRELIASRMPRPETITPGDWWWGALRLDRADEDRQMRIELEGRTRFLRRTVAIPLGTVGIPAIRERGYQQELALGRPAPPVGSLMGFVELQPAVCLCLPLREPDLVLLGQSLESIAAQSYANWRCIVLDGLGDPRLTAGIERLVDEDDRFELQSQPGMTGGHRSAERALELAVSEAPYVGLARQGDRWHPRRLEIMLSAFDTSALLVHSESLSLVNGKPVLRGREQDLANSDCEDLGTLLLSSSVQPGTALVRRELLCYALPLPASHVAPDHWLALVARSLGTVRFVESPLLDRPVARAVGSTTRDEEEAHASRNWRRDYFDHVAPGILSAEMLRVRCWELMRPRDQRALRRYLRAARGRPLAFGAWFRKRKHVQGEIGRAHLRGLAWRRLARFRARLVRSSPET